MQNARATLLLVIAIIVAATKLDVPLVATIGSPFLVALLAAQLDRTGSELAVLLVRAATVLLPRSDRSAFRDEWLDHVCAAGERGVLPLTRAFSICVIAAPLLAVGLRVGRHRSRRIAD
jgi:hypothetical protein